MSKVVKFGGSSLASAEQFQKVGNIIRADKDRIYVVPSAPGKRDAKDTKVTDMLYGCYALAEAGKDFENELMQIKARYDEIITGLNLSLSLDNEFATIRENFKNRAGVDYAASRGEKPFLVILDGVEDPHNLGAVIRSAECCGAHGVIIPKRRAVGLTGTAVKASAGAAEYMRGAKVTNLASTIDYLKERGVWLFAADMGGDSYYETDMNCSAAIVLGSEGFGISRLVKEKCDITVSIPLYGNVNSMNVSCAAAVLLAEAARQRNS